MEEVKTMTEKNKTTVVFDNYVTGDHSRRALHWSTSDRELARTENIPLADSISVDIFPTGIRDQSGNKAASIDLFLGESMSCAGLTVHEAERLRATLQHGRQFPYDVYRELYQKTRPGNYECTGA